MGNGLVCLGSLTKIIAMIFIWTCKLVVATIRWLEIEIEIERTGLGFSFGSCMSPHV